MQIREFSQPVTSKLLNESLAQKFGYRLKLDNFSDVQLEDARNKLRTRLSQFEVNESYDSVLEDPTYQRTKLMLDVINQAILEREMTSSEKGEEKTLKKKYDPSGMKKSMQKQYGKEKGKQVYFATIRKKAMSERADELSIPEQWIDSALNRIELGESDSAELKAELKIRYDLNEAQASWLLLEDEEAKAENIIATKDMVDRITGWLEDVAAMKAEQLLELLDSIRGQQGSDVARQYQDIVKPALESLYGALETAREQVNNGLSVVSGGQVETMGTPNTEFGAEPMPTAEPGVEPMPTAEPGAELEPEVGSEPMPTAEPESNRAKRESVEYSRKLGLMLSSKKK